MGAKKRHQLALASGLGMSSLLMNPTHAAGFYLNTFGTPSSVGTAGVANATQTLGADTAWSNPAAMTYLDSEQIKAGAELIIPNFEFDIGSASTLTAPVTGDDGGNAGDVVAVPSFFYLKPLSDDWRLGFAVTGTLGGGFDYGSKFVGRYVVKEVELSGLFFTPSVAYRVNDQLSVGAGLSAIYASLYQETAIRTDYTPGVSPTPETDGIAEFDDLDDWTYQGLLSLTYEFSDRAMLGVVYRSEADTELEGEFSLKNVATPAKGDLSIDWDNPQWLDVGLRYQLSDKTTLFLNAGWQEWSAFSKNRISFNRGVPVVTDRNWNDTWYGGIAMFRAIDDNSGFSLGVAYDQSPVDDKDRTLDFVVDDMWKIAGAYAWKRDTLDVGLSAALYLQDESKIDQTSQGVRVVGEFDDPYILFLGATVKYEF